MDGDLPGFNLVSQSLTTFCTLGSRFFNSGGRLFTNMTQNSAYLVLGVPSPRFDPGLHVKRGTRVCISVQHLCRMPHRST